MDTILFCLIFLQVGIFFTAGIIVFSLLVRGRREGLGLSERECPLRARGPRTGSPRAFWHAAL